MASWQIQQNTANLLVQFARVQARSSQIHTFARIQKFLLEKGIQLSSIWFMGFSQKAWV